MAIALVTSGKNIATSGNFSISSLNTSGATLAVAAINQYGPSGSFATNSISDSQGNTWTALTSVLSSGGNERMSAWYAIITSTNASHSVTFTNGAGNHYYAATVAFFSGTDTSAPLDQQATAANQAQGTNHTAPSVTPSTNNQLVVSLLGSDGPGGMTANSIDGGFTIAQFQTTSSSTACGLAYLVQTTAAAAAPTWVLSSASAEGGLNSTTYKESGGGPSGPTNLKALNTNVKANIKALNTNPIANIKSINTNT